MCQMRHMFVFSPRNEGTVTMTQQRFAGGTAVIPGRIPVILGFDRDPIRVQQYRNFLSSDPDILVDPGTNTSIKSYEEVWMVWDEETRVRFVKCQGIIPDTMTDPVVYRGSHATAQWAKKLQQTISGVRTQNGHGQSRNGKPKFVRHPEHLLAKMRR